MPSELGLVVTAARKAQGLSLRELARRIKKSAAFVSMLENEAVAPAVKEETLEALARELELDVDLLLGLVGKVPDDARPGSAVDVALFRRVTSLTSEEKRALLKQLEDKS